MAFFTRVRGSRDSSAAVSPNATPASSIGGHMWRNDTLERRTSANKPPNSPSSSDHGQQQEHDDPSLEMSPSGLLSSQGATAAQRNGTKTNGGDKNGGHLTPERGSVAHVPHPLTPTNTGQNSPKLRPQRLGFGQGPLKANHDIVGSPAVVADASGNGTASGNAPSGYASPRSVAVRSVPATPVKATPAVLVGLASGQQSQATPVAPVATRSRQQGCVPAISDDRTEAYTPSRRDSCVSNISSPPIADVAAAIGGARGSGMFTHSPRSKRRSDGLDLDESVNLVQQHRFLSMNDLDAVVSPRNSRDFRFTPTALDERVTPIFQTPELPTMSDVPLSMPSGARGKRLRSMLKTFTMRKSISTEGIDTGPPRQRAGRSLLQTPGAAVDSPYSDGERVTPYKKLNKSWKRLLPATKKKLFLDTPTASPGDGQEYLTPPANKTPVGRTLSHNLPASHRRATSGSPANDSSGSSPTPTNSPVMERRSARPPPPNRSGAKIASPKVTPLPMSPMKPRRPESMEDMFCAIETQDIYQVEELLRNPLLDINATNVDDHTALDLAVMTNAVSIAKLLLSHGAMENQMYIRNRYVRSVRLTTLLNEALEQVERLSHTLHDLVPGQLGGSMTLYSSPKLKDMEDQLHAWEHKCQVLKLMLSTYDSAKPPGAPSMVTLSVYSPTALRVDFDEPAQCNGAVVTRYKIQWSEHANMAGSSEAMVTDLREMRHIITNLTENVPYYVSVQAFNMQGCGPVQLSVPLSAIPSGWKSAMGDEVLKNRLGQSPKFERTVFALTKDLLQSKSVDAADSKGVRKNWFKLFGAKFTHALQPRSLYLAVVFVTDNNRLLVTMDGHLPVLPVDDGTSYRPSQSVGDILWFMKMACSWQGVNHLKEVLASATVASNSVTLRSKLLAATLQAQLSIGQMQLGHLHHEVFVDGAGASVIVSVQEVKKAQGVAASMRWISLTRFMQKRGMAEDSVSDVALHQLGTATQGQAPVRIASPTPRTGALRHVHVFNFSPPTPLYSQIVTALPRLAEFHRHSHSLPPRGLYLSILALRTTISSMSVCVSRSYPAMLPHVKISDNPNVSKDEWWWIQALQEGRQWDILQDNNLDATVALGRSFQQRIARAASRLYSLYAGSTEDADFLSSFHLYTREVIHVSPDVSYLLVIPSTQDMVLAPGQEHCFDDSSDVLYLPLHYHQLMCRKVFLPSAMVSISRLAAMSEVMGVVAQQKLREAFTDDEREAALAENERQANSAKELEKTWQDMLWINDLVDIGRNPAMDVRISLRTLYSNPVASSCHSLQRLGKTLSAEKRALGSSPSNSSSTSARSLLESKRTPISYRRGPMSTSTMSGAHGEGLVESLTTWMSVVMDSSSDDSGFPAMTPRAEPTPRPSSESESTDEHTAPSSPAAVRYSPNTSFTSSLDSGGHDYLSSRQEEPVSNKELQRTPARAKHSVPHREPIHRSTITNSEPLISSPTSRFGRLARLSRRPPSSEDQRSSPHDNKSPKSHSPVSRQLSDRRKGPKLKLPNLSRSPNLGKRQLTKAPSSPLLTYISKDSKDFKLPFSATKSTGYIETGTVVRSPHAMTLIHPQEKIGNAMDVSQKANNDSLKQQEGMEQQKQQQRYVYVYPSHEMAVSSASGFEVAATMTTTACEIVYDLVQRQLSAARYSTTGSQSSPSKGTPRRDGGACFPLPSRYLEEGKLDKLDMEEVSDDFCLLAIVNSHPQLLPDSYCPLQLSNSWTREHLYVRERSVLEKSLRRQKSTSV